MEFLDHTEINEAVIVLVSSIAGIVGAVFSSMITYFAMRRSASTRSVPDLIQSLLDANEAQDIRIEKLETQQKKLEQDINRWQSNYFRLRKWLQKFFKSNGIKVTIPEFHTEEST